LKRARLASRNAHKLDELRASLPGWELELLEAGDYPPEEGATYYENALVKARFGRQHAGPDEWVLGEDSGIEVEALDGRPGIESARWAEDPVSALLEALEGVEHRAARYRGVSPRRPAATRASATTRSSSRSGKTARSRSSATTGRRTTHTAPGPRPRWMVDATKSLVFGVSASRCATRTRRTAHLYVRERGINHLGEADDG
jgi:non-canonical purine NTP pyrophosphatase (RdgB/HAM1 family)